MILTPCDVRARIRTLEGLVEIPVHLHAPGGIQTVNRRIEVSAGAQMRIQTLEHRVRCRKLLDALEGLRTLHFLGYAGAVPEGARAQNSRQSWADDRSRH